MQKFLAQKVLTHKKSAQKLFLVLCMMMGLGLNACQCSDKPDVGPVQESGFIASNPNI